MASPPNTRARHSLQRSIRKLAIDVVRDRDRRTGGRQVNAADEREEQFQIQVSGLATDYPAWATFDLEFDTIFALGNGRRDSGLVRPHVLMGYELVDVLRSNPDTGHSDQVPEGVLLMAAVRKWHFTSSLTIDGATLSVCAHAPTDELSFRGFVHVTVQGFGSPSDAQPDTGG